MSISPLPEREPRSHAALAHAREAMDDIDDMAAWRLGDAELLATVQGLFRLVSIVQAQALRLLAEVDQRGLAADAGSPTTAAWLTATLRTRVGVARRQVKLAHELAERPATATALAAGTVNAHLDQVDSG